MTGPARFSDADACADALIDRLSGRVRLGLPLGLGKAAALANALYRRACQRPEVSLDIFTALTLEVPRPRSELERRFMEPVVERLFRGVPELAYAGDLRRGKLPDNVRVQEFYLRPGALLGVPAAQRRYVSSNYSHAARDLAAAGVNVIAQMVAPPPAAGGRFSLSCNPDLTADLMEASRRRDGVAPLLVGEVSPRLPWLPGDAAERAAEDFDVLLESAGGGPALFPVPNRPVGLADHAIGLRVAGLVRDGGTLQIGIGSLGDAVAHALALRRRDNATYRDLLAALEPSGPAPELDDLPAGLYGASEMFGEGFLHLREAGVLRRAVDGGVFLHAGFYLGSARFYERLRGLPEEERRGIAMTRIAFTNRLLGDEARKRRERVHARFVNTAMMMTLLGAAVSDALEDGRVVSGVGGQHDFVTMGHALEDGRSILALPATRTSKGRVASNIVWRYGHVTVPRHLRDIVVTEYGVADLRGAADQDVIVALLSLADSRFQEGLRRQAVAAGKLSKRYRIPERFHDNRPEALARRLGHPDLQAALPWFPLGSDFDPVESDLAVALGALAEQQGRRRTLAAMAWRGWRSDAEPAHLPALQRMGLDRPGGLREHLYRALVSRALAMHVRGAGRPVLPPTSPTAADKATRL